MQTKKIIVIIRMIMKAKTNIASKMIIIMMT